MNTQTTNTAATYVVTIHTPELIFVTKYNPNYAYSKEVSMAIAQRLRRRFGKGRVAMFGCGREH